MENLKGPFKDIIPMFQKYKQSIGYKYDNIYSYKKLDTILSENNIYTLDNSKLIFEILITNEKNEKLKERNYRCLVELNKFMNILKYQSLYLEPIYFEDGSNFKVRIFTSKEIKKIFKAIDEESEELSTQERYIYPVLFRLIYSCGLRISEALNLKKADFNPKNQQITIYMSKNAITRIIPLSNTMSETISQYFKMVNTENNIYFFELNKNKINKQKVEDFFNRIINKISLSKARIHDFRHTHAVINLDKNGKGIFTIYDLLYPLSIYMGHDSLQSTEWYLQFTKNNYKKVVNKLTKTYPNLIPVVGDNNE